MDTVWLFDEHFNSFSQVCRYIVHVLLSGLNAQIIASPVYNMGLCVCALCGIFEYSFYNQEHVRRCRVALKSFLPWFFSSSVIFLCSHPSLVSVLLQAHPYLWLIFTEILLPLVYFICFAAWQQTHCSVPARVYLLSLSRSKIVPVMNFNISVCVLIASTVNWKDIATCMYG